MTYKITTNLEAWTKVLLHEMDAELVTTAIQNERFIGLAETVLYIRETYSTGLDQTLWSNIWDLLKELEDYRDRIFITTAIDFWLDAAKKNLQICVNDGSSLPEKYVGGFNKLGEQLHVTLTRLLGEQNHDAEPNNQFYLFSDIGVLDNFSDYAINWIKQQPFGEEDTVKLELSERFDQWRKSLSGADMLIRRFWPECEQIFSKGFETVVPIRFKGKGRSLSCTHEAAFGVITTTFVDSEGMAEAFVHEYSHSILNLVSRQADLFISDKGQLLHYSPFRSDARPTMGVLHAAFSFVNVCYLYMRLMSDERYKKQLNDRFCDYVCRLILCLDSLQNFGGLSEFGSNLCLSISDAVEIFRNGNDFKPTNDIIRSRQRHYEKWLAKYSSQIDSKLYIPSFVGKLNELSGGQAHHKDMHSQHCFTLEEMSYKEFKVKHKKLKNVALIRDADIWGGERENSKNLIELLSGQKLRQINLNLHRGYSSTPDQYVSLSQHAEQFGSNDGKYHGYVGAQPISDLVNLESFWKDRQFLADFYLNNREQVIFFNELGTKVLMHWDSGNNIHLVLSGQKTFAFLQPGEHEFLSEFTSGYEEAFSSFDPFSNVDQDYNISKTGEPLIFTQEVSAGDLLFIPAGWWHSVYYKSVSMALSLFDRFY